jgi:hypothetical protein
MKRAELGDTPRWLFVFWRVLELITLLFAGAMFALAILTATGWRP